MKKIIALSLAVMILLTIEVSAQSKLVPILEMNLGGLLGGVQNGKYIDAKTTFARLKGKGNYTIYGTKGKVGELTAEVEPPDAPCEDFYSFKTDLENVSGIAVGANPGWNLTPRTAKTVDLKNPVYVKAVSDTLRAKGIINKAPRLTQILRVDLEGDGQEEILIEANSYENNIQPTASKGDYSFVLLRKIIGGKTQNLVVTGEFITKDIKFGAPGKYEISSLVDLNGDGKLEIFIYGAYYEGSWIESYEMKANKPTVIKTLEANCGV